MDLRDKLTKLDEDLSGAISSSRVKLIAVTKYASDEQIKEAYDLGLRDFGENYVIPALEKIERLKKYFANDVNWHLLGPLQSNKVNKAVGHFATIQSVHSIKLAELINKRAQALQLIQDVYIQVNSTGDKNGIEIFDLANIFSEMAQMKNLQIRGLMTMGLNNFSEAAETIYQNLRHAKETLCSLHPEINLELSMGMSNDCEAAVSNGANIIRIGRRLFAE